MLMPYRGELVYECRFCGKEIRISSAVREVWCEHCQRTITLTEFLQDYLKEIFTDLEVVYSSIGV